MIIDVMANTPLTSPPGPMVKKWCSHTMKERMKIAIVASTIDR